MTEFVEFPDVVGVVAGYLRPLLRAGDYPSVVVSDRYDGDPVAVWVQRDGGPVLDGSRERARIRLNVFHEGPTDQAVDDLARRVSTYMRAMADGAPVVRVEQQSGPTSIADAKPRRYLLFDVTVRGVAL